MKTNGVAIESLRRRGPWGAIAPVLLGIVLGAGACKLAPMEVNIAPTVAVPVTGRGHGITLGVRVVDARPHEELARRTPDGSGLDVFTNQSIARTWGKIVEGALRSSGFEPVPYQPNHDPSLSVWIEELDYNVSSGFFGKKATTTAEVKAEGRRGGSTHEVSFRTERESTVLLFRPSRAEAERALNEAASDVLGKLFSDSKLMAFLGTPVEKPASDLSGLPAPARNARSSRGS